MLLYASTELKIEIDKELQQQHSDLAATKAPTDADGTATEARASSV
jgi:hypothetical protein